MLFPTIAAITIIFLLIGSYTDIKTREVPDWLSYGLIFSAFAISAIFSLELGWQLFLSSLLGFAVCFLIALAFYYSHQWGGGDAKLLMGMGAVIGIAFPFSEQSFSLLFFFLALLFLGAIYGLLWMIVLAILRKTFWAEFKAEIREQKKTHYVLLAATLILLIPSIVYPLFLPLLVFPLGIFYLFIFVNLVERNCFIKRIPVERLTPGDWLAEDVKLHGKVFMQKKTLDEKDLVKIKETALKHVIIKEGVPFIPAFLLAYLLLIFGDNVWDWFYRLLF